MGKKLDEYRPVVPNAEYEDIEGNSVYICRHPVVLLEECQTVLFWWQFYSREKRSVAQQYNDPQLHPLHDEFISIYEGAYSQFTARLNPGKG